jgi:ABC-type multidrug transport system fused ATPase/permease subunit
LFRSAHLSKEAAMVVADVSFADIFWSVLWFFFLFIWLMILFQILTDLFRDHSVSGVEKTLWVLFLVFLPFLAVFIYLIVRGKGMGERAAARQQQAQEQFEGYVRNVATPAQATPTEQIARAKELLDAGAIDQSEFDRLKAKALAGALGLAWGLPGRLAGRLRQTSRPGFSTSGEPSAGVDAACYHCTICPNSFIQWRQVGERPD